MNEAKRNECQVQRPVSRLLHCAFCGRSEREVRKLIHGPGAVCICDLCVDICMEVMGFKHGGTVFAFEWNNCIHESAFHVVSLHQNKRDAFKAMNKAANERWQQDRDMELQYGKTSYTRPLQFEAWGIRAMPVQPANTNSSAESAE